MQAIVRLHQKGNSPGFETSRGWVRQDCIPSTYIVFNIFGEYIMRKILDVWSGGTQAGSQTICNLRFAHDTTLCACSKSELRPLLDRVEKNSKERNLALIFKGVIRKNFTGNNKTTSEGELTGL